MGKLHYICGLYQQQVMTGDNGKLINTMTISTTEFHNEVLSFFLNLRYRLVSNSIVLLLKMFYHDTVKQFNQMLILFNNSC